VNDCRPEMICVFPAQTSLRMTGCLDLCKALPAPWGSDRISSSGSTCYPMHSRCSTVPQNVEGVAAAGMHFPCLTDKVHLLDVGRHSGRCYDCTRMVPPTLSLGFLGLKKYVQVGKPRKPSARMDLATARLVRLAAACVDRSHRGLVGMNRTRDLHT
jgi:hypothetical protein